MPTWRKIPTTTWPTRRLLGSVERPAPVERGFVEGLIAAAGDAGVIDARPDAVSDIDAGSKVLLIGGPFSGFGGVVVGTAGASIKVSVIIFAKETEVVMPRQWVEVI